MRLFVYLLLVLVPFMPQMARATPTLIAGSGPGSPPTFIPNSIWPFSSSFEEAFRFLVDANGPYQVTMLQVAVYHYPSPAPEWFANFSIWSDNGGVPGLPIGTFEPLPVSAIQQVLTTMMSQLTVLNSNTSYWLVAQTSADQLNWNMAPNASGMRGYRYVWGPWTTDPYAQLPAYAILGTPIPEPMSVFLFCGALLGIRMDRRRHARDMISTLPRSLKAVSRR